MAEPRTLDNPNDVAIREQQKQQRLAQGQATKERQARDANPEPLQFEQPFTFRFRKIKNTSFAGLWELAVMKPGDPKKVDELIFDANALPECLEAIGNIFANRGY